MQLISHRIDLSAVNDLALPMSVTVAVNDESMIHRPLPASGEYVLEFQHDYQGRAANTLKLRFQGQEQQSKRVTLKKIMINSQPINVITGFYVPDRNAWWDSLSREETLNYKKQILSHGGELGWFGSISYEYVDWNQMWTRADGWTLHRAKIHL